MVASILYMLQWTVFQFNWNQSQIKQKDSKPLWSKKHLSMHKKEIYPWIWISWPWKTYIIPFALSFGVSLVNAISNDYRFSQWSQLLFFSLLVGRKCNFSFYMKNLSYGSKELLRESLDRSNIMRVLIFVTVSLVWSDFVVKIRWPRSCWGWISNK